MKLAPGDRVRTASGKRGVILPPPFLMPNHQLVDFGGGDRRWVLSEALKKI